MEKRSTKKGENFKLFFNQFMAKYQTVMSIKVQNFLTLDIPAILFQMASTFLLTKAT